MSVDVLISPRISFSHDVDLSEDDDPSVPSETFPGASSSVDDKFDFDFAFSVDNQGALIRQSSTADELFSDGKLLPVSINLITNNEITDTGNPNLVQIRSPVTPCFEIKQEKIIKSLKEYLEDETDIEDDDNEEESEDSAPQPTMGRAFWNFRRSNSGKQSIPSKLKLLSRSKSTGVSDARLSIKGIEREEEEISKPGLPTLVEDDRSFWKFKRSNSLDYESSTQNRGGLIGSLKVILLRTNSIGEVLTKTTTEDPRQFRITRSSSLNCHRYNLTKGSIMGRSNSTGSVYDSNRSGIHNEKKELSKQNSANRRSGRWKKGQRQGRRSFKDYYENFYSGDKVNPVLNLPSPYISRASVDLLGFSSLFCNARYKNKRK